MSLLGVIGTIAGGLLGRPKTKSAGQNRYSDIQGLMAAAKDFGWNPLTLLTNGQAIGPTVIDNSAFGNAVANAGMMLGEQMSAKRAEKAKMEKLNQTQARLQKRLEAITLRSPVPGVYGRAKLPSDPEVYGNGDGSGDARVAAASTGGPARYQRPSGASTPSGLRPIETTDPIDERRDVDVKAVPNSAGFVTIDNPYLPFKVYVPSLDGDETLGPDMVTVPLSVAGSFGYDRAGKDGEAHWNRIFERMARQSRGEYRRGETVRKHGGIAVKPPYRGQMRYQ